MNLFNIYTYVYTPTHYFLPPTIPLPLPLPPQKHHLQLHHHQNEIKYAADLAALGTGTRFLYISSNLYPYSRDFAYETFQHYTKTHLCSKIKLIRITTEFWMLMSLFFLPSVFLTDRKTYQQDSEMLSKYKLIAYAWYTHFHVFFHIHFLHSKSNNIINIFLWNIVMECIYFLYKHSYIYAYTWYYVDDMIFMPCHCHSTFSDRNIAQ